MDSYKTPDTASIFNFKRIQNDFVNDVGFQEFYNELRNPHLSEMRQGNAFAWNEIGTVDLTTPTAIDLDHNTISFDFIGASEISQDVSLVLDTEYTAILDINIDNINADVKFEITSANDIFISNSGLTNSIEIDLGDGTNIIRFKVADNVSLGFEQFKIKNALGSEDTEITFKNLTLTKGNIALLGAKYSEIDQLVRWNNANNYWEISVDNKVTWERIWTEGQDFENYLTAIIDQQNVGLIHQDNMIAGEGIIITPSTVPDGMGGEWPALTITNDGEVGGTTGGGLGDWTKEDVYYQQLLASSSYSHVSYNTLINLESEAMIGGASYVDIVDGYGVGSISGSQNDGFETNNIVNESGTYSTFYVDALIEGNKNVTVEYSINNGSGFGGWLSGNYKETTYTTDFTGLRVRLLFVDAGITKLYSFGVLYGYDSIEGMEPSGFVEILEQDLPASTNVELPNGKWYHINGESLEIFYDGLRLLANDDYVEVNVGYGDKSNTVAFNFPLEVTKTVVFKEVYSFGSAVYEQTNGTSDWDFVNSSRAILANEKLMVDTSLGSFTLTLPLNPTLGDTIEFIDAEGTHDINNLIIGRNGNNIAGLTEDLNGNLKNARWKLTYYNASRGWKVNY